MKIKLNVDNILKNIYTEENLADMSLIESLYQIRKLKAIIKYFKDGFLELNPLRYSKEFEVFFAIDDYEEIK
jgi:hypothetical protein